MENQYIPGVCNIGTAEKKVRLKAAYVGTFLTFIIVAAAFIFSTEKTYRIFSTPFFFFAILNYLQSRHSFCVKFGVFKEYNFGPKIGVTAAIVDKESIKKDKQKSIKIIIQSIILTVLFLAILLGL